MRSRCLDTFLIKITVIGEQAKQVRHYQGVQFELVQYMCVYIYREREEKSFKNEGEKM